MDRQRIVACRRYRNSVKPQRAAAVAQVAYTRRMPLPAPTPTMEKIGDALDELLHDAMLKIVYGQEPLSYFDRVVARWHELGGDAMTDEVNAWYASLSKTR